MFESDRSGMAQIYWLAIDSEALPVDTKHVHQISDDEFDNSQPDFFDLSEE